MSIIQVQNFQLCSRTVTRKFFHGEWSFSRYSTARRLPQDSAMNVFDRKTKLLQKERSALLSDVHVYDYLKDEIGYRLSDRVFDVKRKFKSALDLGCSRGYVSKNIIGDSVEKLTLCDMSRTLLDQASHPEEGVEVKRMVVDEENLPFEEDTFDLVISNLALHWVNDLPGTLSQILHCLVKDGVFLASVFGGDTLFELSELLDPEVFLSARTNFEILAGNQMEIIAVTGKHTAWCSLQMAEMERRGGISPHISPFTDVRDIGSLLTRAGFTMLTLDSDEITIGYPSMFELMKDLKGMGESNAAWNRSLHLSRETMFAASAIYQHIYGKDGTIPATFQTIYMVGWKPHPSQPKPARRGSGQMSLKDIHRIDEITKEIKKVDLGDDNDRK